MTDYKIDEVAVINTKSRDLSEYNGERVLIVDKLLDHLQSDYEVKFSWGEKVKVRADELTPIKDKYKYLKLKVGDDIGLLYENEDKVRVSKIDWINEQVEIQYDNENFKVVKLSDVILENDAELEWVKVTDKVENKEDVVNNPSHYKSGGIETLDYIKAKTKPEAFQGFLVGNVIKYISRYEHKNGLEDLKKAKFYLDKLITEKESVK
ncbi:gp62 protein [Peribacillus asahii]|uniref:Gp62 protein n=1 Tax=Peribacillus asahii TaxID=228899 RepID=A0A3T0KT11_9BACI|nr:DUF3310 domain-containing protein [Peribacillus asahii]AZV43579.1 gp62 protein [Peribacillus asahii]